MITDISARHFPAILKYNAEYVHWLSPLSAEDLQLLLSKCGYARTIDDGDGFLFGYNGHSDYRHKCVDYLCGHLESYGYIDRVIIATSAHGKGLAQTLYDDFERWSRAQGFAALGCEVNTQPNNPRSHRFHQRLGFQALGEVAYPAAGKALRYYAKWL